MLFSSWHQFFFLMILLYSCAVFLLWLSRYVPVGFSLMLLKVRPWHLNLSIFLLLNLQNGITLCSGVGDNPDLTSGGTEAARGGESAPLTLEQLQTLHEGKLEDLGKAEDYCKIKERQLHGLASYRYGVLRDSLKCDMDSPRYPEYQANLAFCDSKDPQLMVETAEARKQVSTLKKECSELTSQINVQKSLLELEDSVIRRNGLQNTPRKSILPYSPNKTLSKKH